MKVAIFSSNWENDLQKKINNFIQNRNVVDIKYAIGNSELLPTFFAFVHWDDSVDCTNCKNVKKHIPSKYPCNICIDKDLNLTRFKPIWEEE